MVAEIICVGTEILLGNIVNTNAAYLAKELADLGIANYYQLAVGDNVERLYDAISVARSRSDVIILSGGLGPTDDDLTKEVCAKVFGKNLVMDDAAKQNIIDIFERRGLSLTDNNWKQALVPEGSTVLYNKNGTAPGIIIECDEKIAILLPGPPHELIPMFQEQVKPYFEAMCEDTFYSKMVKMVFSSESKVADEIKDLLQNENPTVATYAKPGEVHIRVTAKSSKSFDDAKSLVMPYVKYLKDKYGDKVYSTEADETLEESVVKLLKEKKYTITTAESCTGGLIASTIVNVPGSSDVFGQGFVTYSNKAKKKMLGVKKTTLEKYGAVSEQVAKEMAKGARKEAKAGIAVAVTGIAGPGGGTEEKPVGLVYIACATESKVIVRKFDFNGNRNKIRRLTTANALAMVRMCLSDKSNS